MPGGTWGAFKPSYEKKKIVVFGGTGAYLGQHVTRAALDLGHEVTVITRGRNERNAALIEEFEKRGAKTALVDNTQIDKMVEIFTGQDVVFSFPGIDSHRSEQIRVLWAAKLAGVKRFMPDEFGCDTTAIDFGLCGMFDQKKDMTVACRASDVPFTAIMCHAIATDWMMPTHFNQEAYSIIGSGDVKLRLTHKKDVAALAVMAACDDRCANKAVSLDGGGDMTIKEMVAEVRKNFPDHTFEYKQRSADDILQACATGSSVAPLGEQSPKEREELNKLVYIDGAAARVGAETLKATELWPEHGWVFVRDLLANPTFVFGEGKEPKQSA